MQPLPKVHNTRNRTPGSNTPIAPKAPALVRAPAVIPRMLTIAEAERYAGIKTTSIYKLAAEGRFKIFKLGRRSLIERVQLDAFLSDLPAADVRTGLGKPAT